MYLPAGRQGTCSLVQVAIEDVQAEGRLRVAAQPLLGVDRLATVLQVRTPVLLSAFRQLASLLGKPCLQRLLP